MSALMRPSFSLEEEVSPRSTAEMRIMSTLNSIDILYLSYFEHWKKQYDYVLLVKEHTFTFR